MAESDALEPDLKRVRPVLVVLATTAILVGLFCLMLWFGLRLVAPQPAPAVFETRPVPPPGQPALQTDPARDWAELERRQRERLSSVGWVDREAGIVHLPIDRAMTLVVERGLDGEGSP